MTVTAWQTPCLEKRCHLRGTTSASPQQCLRQAEAVPLTFTHPCLVGLPPDVLAIIWDLHTDATTSICEWGDCYLQAA